MKLYFPIILVFICAVGCKEKNSSTLLKGVEEPIEEAKGFSITDYKTYKVITVHAPWPKAERDFTYALARDITKIPTNQHFDAVVKVPVKSMVVTSTTHIPALEALHSLGTLVGFPDTKYISSKPARALINEGKIQDIGQNESINTEMLLNLKPDVVIGFSINNQNKTYKTIQNSGIPVVYNGDWTEETPLGKAEWIKFFAPFFEKEKEANHIFTTIKSNYNSAKKLALSATEKPTVLSGAMYKDVWYLPAGKSWGAQFIKDANANYLWSESEGNGSLSLNFENVFLKATHADFWIAPSQFISYDEMKKANNHYTKFDAFNKRQIYTYALTKGDTGGLLYYELGPQRPDLVLKDLIHIFHPELLKDYQPYFFKPLQ
ncbi:ABC transporter substrate-binding protein [Zhouia sp. PK063]|uniref:ABC transporter substrate-binding protein n=1 Tax=Zhouia sp. PK063 TaxID=3373602 RepID=UPI00378A26F6